MKLEIVNVDDTNAYIVKNLLPLFHHDIAEYYEIQPNEHGIIFGEDSKTLGEHCKRSYTWFDNGINEKESFFPFLVYADNLPAGFAIVLGNGNSDIPVNTDYYMALYFILGAYRGHGVATRTAHLLFDRFKGRWLIYTNPTPRNNRGQKFWHKTINLYTDGLFDETYSMTNDGEKKIFRFSSI